MLQEYNIDTELVSHVRKIRAKIYPIFTQRTKEFIAERSTEGYMSRLVEADIVQSTIFFKLIDEQYLSVLYDLTNKIKTIFDSHGIEFRLYDIGEVRHGFQHLTFLWNSRGGEYIFDFCFDSAQHNTFPSYYKIGLINSCGELVDGDILHGSAQYFEDNSDLPQWFIDGLRHNT